MSKTNKSNYKFWKVHIEGWQSSGLSQRKYCHREGLKLTTFCYWRRCIKEAVTDETKPSQFLAVKKPMSSSDAKQAAIQLMLPNGVRIGISSTADKEVIQDVLSFAGAL